MFFLTEYYVPYFLEDDELRSVFEKHRYFNKLRQVLVENNFSPKNAIQSVVRGNTLISSEIHKMFLDDFSNSQKNYHLLDGQVSEFKPMELEDYFYRLSKILNNDWGDLVYKNKMNLVLPDEWV